MKKIIIFNPKKLVLNFQEYDARNVYPGSRIRGQKSTGSRIRICWTDLNPGKKELCLDPVQDFDSDTLAALLDFMYTAQITISEDNAQDILIGQSSFALFPGILHKFCKSLMRV